MQRFMLEFPHRLALPSAPKGARLRLALLHSLLALGFTLPLAGPLLASAIVLVGFVMMAAAHSAYTLDGRRFLLQRILLTLAAGGGFFWAQYAGYLTAQSHWQLFYYTLAPLYFYDAFLAYNGMPGMFYLNWRGKAS